MSVFLPKYTMPDKICLAMPICSAKGKGMLKIEQSLNFFQSSLYCFTIQISNFLHFKIFLVLKVCHLHAAYKCNLLLLNFWVFFVNSTFVTKMVNFVTENSQK